MNTMEVATYEMYCGLGNIGKRFERTRHNIGFEVIDYILDKNQFTLDKQNSKALILLNV